MFEIRMKKFWQQAELISQHDSLDSAQHTLMCYAAEDLEKHGLIYLAEEPEEECVGYEGVGWYAHCGSNAKGITVWVLRHLREWMEGSDFWMFVMDNLLYTIEEAELEFTLENVYMWENDYEDLSFWVHACAEYHHTDPIEREQWLMTQHFIIEDLWDDYEEEITQYQEAKLTTYFMRFMVDEKIPYDEMQEYDRELFCEFMDVIFDRAWKIKQEKDEGK